MEKTTKVANFKGIEKVNEFLNFSQWCAIPDPLKEPKTQKEFALQVNVTEQTLSEWKQHPQFLDLVRQEIKKWGKNKTHNVIGGLYRKAIADGNAAEAKLWLQYIEEWEEKTLNKNLNVEYKVISIDE